MTSAVARTFCVFLAVLSGVSCTRTAGDDPPPAAIAAVPTAEPPEEQQAPVGFDLRNVRMHAAPDVILAVDYLQGTLVPTTRPLPIFDDLKSFYITVESAKLSIDARSMNALVKRVFDYEGSPLSDLEIAIEEGRVEQKGKLRKGISVPFSVAASVTSDQGRIRLHPEKVKVIGIPAGDVMKVFGLELDDLLKLRAGAGVAVRGNDLFLEPSQLMRSPEIRGKVSAAQISGDRLLLTLGEPSPARREVVVPDSDAKNYIWFHGGRIRFGRLTMSDADLQLIDGDPGDAFDFVPLKYRDQLIAGFSRNTGNGALRTTMPDFADIPNLPGGRLFPAPVRTRLDTRRR